MSDTCLWGTEISVETEATDNRITFDFLDDETRSAPEQKPPDPSRRQRRWRVVRSVAIVVSLGLIATIAYVVGKPIVENRQRTECAHRLRQIGAAFHEYQEAHGHFPAGAITDKHGAPLLSWRVEILPHLGYQTLYDQFRKDEPWDSPHNQALLREMPTLFACPADSARGSHECRYRAIVGPKAGLGTVGTMFELARGIEIREVLDGTSTTVMVAEASASVPWTKPDELSYTPGETLPHFRSHHPKGFHILLGDGSTRFVGETVSETTLRALLTRDGSEVLSAG